MKKLLKLKDVQEILNISKSTMQRLIDANEIRYVEIGSNPDRRTIRIKEEWVEDYINSKQRQLPATTVPKAKSTGRKPNKYRVSKY